MVTVTDRDKGTPPELGELFDFRWWVDPGGYELRPIKDATQASSESSRVLLSGEPKEIVPKGPLQAMDPIYPIRMSPSLAREFAEVGDSADDVLAFVNKYGLLWRDRKLFVDDFQRFKRMVRDLRNEIAACRRKSANAEYNYKAAEFDRLRHWFNGVMSDQLIFRLRIATDKRRESWRQFQVQPSSLLSAIGLLLAHEIAGEIETVPCKKCGDYFTRGRPFTDKRRDAEFCSDECSKAWANAQRAIAVTKERAQAKAARAPSTKPICPHCRDEYTPKRAGSTHCGAPACKQAAYRLRKKQSPTQGG